MNMFGDPISIWTAVPCLLCSLVLYTMFLGLIVAFLQYDALAWSEELSHPWRKSAYAAYQTMAHTFQVYSFVDVVLGSPIYTFVVKLLGGKIEGRALLFPQRLHEFSLLRFLDRTIVDSSHVTGHYGIYNEIVIGPCRVGGVLREGVYAANALVLSGSDPWRAFVGTYQGQGDDSSLIEGEDDNFWC